MTIDSNNRNVSGEKRTETSHNTANPSNFTHRHSSDSENNFAAVLKNSDGLNQSRNSGDKTDKSSESRQTDTEESEFTSKTKDREKIQKESREGSDTEKKSESDQAHGFGQMTRAIQNGLNEINLPGARAILHIADLERIISSIRSETVNGGKQITIELKNSVLQGLELKLTIGKDKNVVAEFFAANESVRQQLNAKADELAVLLRDRGIKLTKLEMSLSSDSNQKEKQAFTDTLRSNGAGTSAKRVDKLTETQTNVTILSYDSDISYQV